MVALALQYGNNYFHDERTKRGHSQKYALHNTGSQRFKLSIGILDQFKGWVTKFIILRCDQVLKYVDGGEARNLVTFMHGNGTLNCHVRVLLSRIKIL